MPSGSIDYRGNAIQFNRTVSLLHPPNPYVFEDFLVDVLADSPYVTVTQSGTATGAAAISATAGDPVAGYGGWVAGATDDVDAEIDEVSIGGLGTGAGTPWLRADVLATGIIVCEWGLSIPTALTARQYFAGLSDDPVEGTGTNGALNIQTAYTLVDVANDAAGFVFSSLATAPTLWKKASTDSGTGSSMAAANDTLTAVANTWTGLRVEVDVAGDTYFYTRATRGGSLTGWGKTDVGLSPDVLLVPTFSAAPTTTTAVDWEVDYCFATSAVRA